MVKKLKKSKNTPRSSYPSWLTTDEQEVDIRKKRANIEAMSIKPITSPHPVFTDYIVYRNDIDSPQKYRVEIRSLDKKQNYCSCPDFAKNFLGTCKHIEKVLAVCQRKVKKRRASPFVEVFVDYLHDLTLMIDLPITISPEINSFLDKYLNEADEFKQPITDTLQVFIRDYEDAPSAVRNTIRVSEGIFKLHEKITSSIKNNLVKKRFNQKLKKSAGNVDFLKFPLYDYQVEGMLHLAFAGRAMLADEMGLGKTVQAIAAANVLHDLHDIKRVIIVSPASLKTEWEEQIRKFTSLSSTIVFGNKKERLQLYRESNDFFVLTNYEQILRDYQEINELYQPDLIILDEAQRIKNWKTKTATSIKRLHSKYAFILTGTPIENRIDELYSITEFIDPTVFGSLFRFNRRFYKFSPDGKTAGLKNLRELHETMKPVMVRRRKDEIEEQLPERIDNNYFVSMTPEQKKRYEEYSYQVSILMNIAKRRPLRPEEHEKLQRGLGCMRMLCDSVYILDQSVSESPKVDELLKILNDIWTNEPERKVLIFSEWVRMLDLVSEQLEDNHIKFGWHVGSVPQHKRREEINKFKDDPDCKVFLSSDSGSVGLNLQAASVVVNLDLPWNPAKLEQRIARAWRKHQKNSVNVINLVAEKTIEHRMLATLSFKQELADGVLDNRGNIDELEKPNAKSKFMERLASIMETSFVHSSGKNDDINEESLDIEIPPSEKLHQELNVNMSDNLKLCSGIYDEESSQLKSVLAVAESPSQVHEQLNNLVQKTHHDAPKKDSITVINEDTYKLLEQLAAQGIITFNQDKMQTIFENKASTTPPPDDRKQRLNLATPIIEAAERKLKMATVLAAGGFPDEAKDPAIQAVISTGKVLQILVHDELLNKEPDSFNPKCISKIKEKLSFSKEHLRFLNLCSNNVFEDDQDMLKQATEFIEETGRFLTEYSL